MKRIAFLMIFSLLLLCGCSSDDISSSLSHVVLRDGEANIFTIKNVQGDYTLEYDDDIITIENGVVKYKDVGRTTVVLKSGWFIEKELFTVDCVSFQTGDGSIDNPFVVNNVDDFNRIRIFNDKAYKLNSDLSLGSFVPIDEFYGIFDGNNHTLYTINFTGTNRYIGVFSKIISGKVKNLNINSPAAYIFDKYDEGIYEDDYLSSLGLLAGLVDDSLIINCQSSGSIITDGKADFGVESVGGLIGIALGVSTIIDCKYEGRITTDLADFVGGLVGLNASVIKGCYSKADIFTNDFDQLFVGGLVGKSMGKIQKSFFEGNLNINSLSEIHKPVNPSQSYAGLLVGYVKEASIEETYALGSINGYTKGQDSFVRPVTIGGLIGYSNDEINTSFCAVRFYIDEIIEDYFTVGAFVGLYDVSESEKAFKSRFNYYNKDLFVTENESELQMIEEMALIGLTTTQMYNKNSYETFDFDASFIERENNYPALR